MDDDGSAASRWERLQSLFEEALERPPEDRTAWLGESVPDPELRRRVASLVAAHEGQGRLDSLTDALARVGGAGEDAVGEVPSRVGPYRIREAIGEGGMASVFLAVHDDRPEEGPVAVKVIRPESDSDRVRRRFVTEGQLLAGIEHPGIARFLDEGVTEDGALYLVTELVDGTPIDKHCDKARLPLVDRVGLVVEVCNAVAHAHGLGVIHRDIKPANVLVSRDGRPKLLDFGIAKILEDGAFGSLHRRTSTGVSLATFHYAAPEQLLLRPVSVQSDVYQLGALLYLLASGFPPPLRAKVQSARGQKEPSRGMRPSDGLVAEARSSRRRSPAEVAQRRATSVDDLVRELQSGLDDIVERATREETTRRHGSAEELADDLRRWLDGAWRPEGPVRAFLRRFRE